jgi:hypothetical protein
MALSRGTGGCTGNTLADIDEHQRAAPPPVRALGHRRARRRHYVRLAETGSRGNLHRREPVQGLQELQVLRALREAGEDLRHVQAGEGQLIGSPPGTTYQLPTSSMADAKTQQKLTPKKYSLGVGGLAIAGTGGCLMWTIVLIPLALPMALIGLGMAVGSLFVKTERIVCPVCEQASKVEKAVNVITCPHCEKAIKRGDPAWIAL